VLADEAAHPKEEKEGCLQINDIVGEKGEARALESISHVITQ
jgi:hypothetical protein